MLLFPAALRQGAVKVCNYKLQVIGGWCTVFRRRLTACARAPHKCTYLMATGSTNWLDVGTMTTTLLRHIRNYVMNYYRKITVCVYHNGREYVCLNRICEYQCSRNIYKYIVIYYYIRIHMSKSRIRFCEY